MNRDETDDVLQAMQRLATQTLAPVPPPYETMRLRAEFTRRQQHHARPVPVQTLVSVGTAAVLVTALFWWAGAPPQPFVRTSIDAATHASHLFTSGLGVAILFGLAILTWVLMDERATR